MIGGRACDSDGRGTEWDPDAPHRRSQPPRGCVKRRGGTWSLVRRCPGMLAFLRLSKRTPRLNCVRRSTVKRRNSAWCGGLVQALELTLRVVRTSRNGQKSDTVRAAPWPGARPSRRPSLWDTSVQKNLVGRSCGKTVAPHAHECPGIWESGIPMYDPESSRRYAACHSAHEIGNLSKTRDCASQSLLTSVPSRLPPQVSCPESNALT